MLAVLEDYQYLNELQIVCRVKTINCYLGKLLLVAQNRCMYTCHHHLVSEVKFAVNTCIDGNSLISQN